MKAFLFVDRLMDDVANYGVSTYFVCSSSLGYMYDEKYVSGTKCRSLKV